MNKNYIKILFLEYIKEKGFILGQSRMEGNQEIIIEKGLCNDDVQRCDLNALYFLDLIKYLPPWPQPFQKSMKGFIL